MGLFGAHIAGQLQRARNIAKVPTNTKTALCEEHRGKKNDALKDPNKGVANADFQPTCKFSIRLKKMTQVIKVNGL